MTKTGLGEVVDDDLGFVLVEKPVGLLYVYDLRSYKRCL